jgi:PAS domain S-box-containing protein
LNVIGYTQEEVLQMTLYDSLPVSSLKKAKLLINDILDHYKKGDKDFESVFEVQRYHKDGSLIWVEVSLNVTVDANDKFSEMVAVERVIEDRKKLEAYILSQHFELQEEENKYQIVTGHSRDMICSMDIKTMQYTYVSESCLQITGFTREEFLEAPIYRLLPPDAVKKITKMINESVGRYVREKKLDSDVVFEIQRYHKNGSLI